MATYPEKGIDQSVALTKKHLLAVWIVLSSSLMIVGATGPWLTVSTILGGISFSGTFIGSKAGGAAFGAGWEILGAAVIAGSIGLLALFHSRRWPLKLAGLLALLAVAESVYVMVRSASVLTNSTEYAQAAWGWGLIVSLIASLSLTAALVTTTAAIRKTPVDSAVPRWRRLSVVLGVALALALAAAAAEGFVIAEKQAKIDQFPTRLSEAREEAREAGHSAGYDEGQNVGHDEGYDEGYDAAVSYAQAQVDGCYETAYQDGYLAGWNAVVDELSASGAVEGGEDDFWYDPTTLGSCGYGE